MDEKFTLSEVEGSLSTRAEGRRVWTLKISSSEVIDILKDKLS
jgi:hypothetical protein